jgi:hypothetical protein
MESTSWPKPANFTQALFALAGKRSTAGVLQITQAEDNQDETLVG